MFSGLGRTKNKQDEDFLKNICEQIKSYAESRGYEIAETYRKVGQNLATKGIVDSIKTAEMTEEEIQLRGGTKNDT